MSKADELLASLTDEEFAAYSEIGPVDDVLLIDAETRTINVPSTELLFGVETDKDVERKYFKCPRIVGDNVDLSKLSLRVHYQNANGDKDKYIIEDVKVVGDYITFSWLLSAKLLAYKGSVHFTVVAVSINADGTLNKEWNTTLATGNVLEGMEVEDLDYAEEEQARDVLAQLLAIFEKQKNASIEEVQNEAATQMQNIEDKGAEVLATIPVDYTEMDKTVKQHTNDIYDLARNKASAIVGEVVGESIFVTDAASQPPIELSLFGKTEQSPYTKGYQLFDASKLSTTSAGGATATNNGDGSLTISGSGELTSTFFIMHQYTSEESLELLKAGTVYLKTEQPTAPYVVFGLYHTSDNSATDKVITNNTLAEVSTILTDDDIAKIADGTYHARIYIYCPTGYTINPGTIKPMLYQDGDGTWERFSGGKPGPNPEYPFELEDVENPELVKLGKNLLIDSKIPAKGTMRGITCEYEGDGVFHIYGTFDSTAPDGGLQLATTYLEIPTTPDDVYTLSAQLLEGSIPFRIHPYLGIGNDTVDCKNWFSLWMEPGMKVGAVTSSTYSAGVPLADATRIPRFWIYGYNESKEALSGDFRIKVWFEKSHNNTGYKVCEEGEVELPYTLRGLKLTGTQHESYANFIDSNGDKWVGDELDLHNGILYQWIEPMELTDFSSANVSASANGYTEGHLYLGKKLLVNHAISDSFQYIQSGVASVRFAVLTGGGVYITLEGEYTADEWKAKMEEISPTIYIALAEPAEIQLTQSEIEAYRKVMMSNPITTLFNRVGAPMKLTYAKDTSLCVGVRTDEITLSASKWVEQDGGSYYTQVVSVSGITANTRIDLAPTPEQLINIVDEGISMFASNQNGVVTVYATGGQPSSDMTLPINKQEVVYV